MSAEFPTDPKAVKTMKKALAKEAQADEKEYRRTLEELKRTERSEVKASKAAGKSDKHLKKMEDKEHDTVRSLQQATHQHDRAVTDLHRAQGDAQIQKQHAQRLRQNVDSLKVRANELFSAKRTRDEERNQKLARLRSPG